MSQENITAIDADNIVSNSSWIYSPEIVELYASGYTGSILLEDDDAYNYAVYTVAMFIFFMGLHYFWWLVFEKCWIIERYHDEKQVLFKEN